MFEDFDFSVLDDPSFKEDAVREEIIAPILKRLGYQPSGRYRVERSKNLVHPFVHIGTRRHRVNIIPDYTLWCDDKALLVLDAKSPGEDIRRSHHVEQAYSYAIHPEVRCEHYALCNGRQLILFHINEFEPLLVFSIKDCDSKWGELEKFLAPRYLLKPVLRRFDPDMGLAVMKLGISSEASLSFLGCRIGFLARVSDDLYTASSACEFVGGRHLASFDFPPSLFEPILSCLAWPLAQQVRDALSHTPYRAHADMMLEVDWTTRLGVLTKGLDEYFVPFVVTAVIASRFNRTYINDPREKDIPESEFRLRHAFEALQSSGR